MAIRINRVCTRGGDQGLTSLVGGQRVPKDSLRIESFGTVDELNAVLGVVRAALAEKAPASMQPEAFQRADGLLDRIQGELFNLGCDLATDQKEPASRPPMIQDRHVEGLESDLESLNTGLPELTSFVLPGGGTVSAFLHQARTVCRRAERAAIALSHEEPVTRDVLVYLNRLSDLLFVLGRWLGKALGEREVLWDPGKA